MEKPVGFFLGVSWSLLVNLAYMNLDMFYLHGYQYVESFKS
jgi:hypothetical protein